jgi:hypothetical protein
MRWRSRLKEIEEDILLVHIGYYSRPNYFIKLYKYGNLISFVRSFVLLLFLLLLLLLLFFLQIVIYH